LYLIAHTPDGSQFPMSLQGAPRHPLDCFCLSRLGYVCRLLLPQAAEGWGVAVVCWSYESSTTAQQAKSSAKAGCWLMGWMVVVQWCSWSQRISACPLRLPLSQHPCAGAEILAHDLFATLFLFLSFCLFAF
jgi:hypothetical protein